MKGKYISTSLMLAVLAGTKEGFILHINETKADPKDHQLIWSKTADTGKKGKTETNPA
ncbi:MAG: hypothetical protein M0Q26_12070 [Chitinophagaceae bacterium]|nr:hypothetical protein [Chitinophagaceae bacterium]MDP1764735.1 hypothetical protein [Sediminibacterium sp.]MDP1812226.1 hypothetical protein [Sediminibacterium sp.]MDP3128935.1 hypothetical protein [Sediminibacterium sp.]MDP3667385.1 hypothetical protein [Sediminibacterium sp.]